MTTAATRATLALAVAGLRYWPAMARQVRAQLADCERRAGAIEDEELRALALHKLRGERFNAEAAAMLATLAPRAHRRAAAQAIVALELLFDYLDGLTERPLDDPLADAERLHEPFLSALDSEPGGAGEGDRADVYSQRLGATARAALAELPAWPEVAPVARRCAARGVRAQARMHAVPRLGTTPAREWARGEARASEMGWRDFLAGAACSVLGLHALVAAAADARTTRAEAERIDVAYMPVGAVVTLLDGLVDHERDAAAGEPSYVSLYGDRRLAEQALVRMAQRALREVEELRHASHHATVLAAAVAHGCSAPDAASAAAAPAIARLRRELGALTLAPSLLMRAWRTDRRQPDRRQRFRDGERLAWADR